MLSNFTFLGKSVFVVPAFAIMYKIYYSAIDISM